MAPSGRHSKIHGYSLTAPSGRHSKIHGYLPYAWWRHQVDTARFMVTFLMPDGAIRWTQQDSWLPSLCLMAPSGRHSKIHGYLPYAWWRHQVGWRHHSKIHGYLPYAWSGRHSKIHGYLPYAWRRHQVDTARFMVTQMARLFIHGYLPYAWWRHQVGTARFMVTFLMPDGAIR